MKVNRTIRKLKKLGGKFSMGGRKGKRVQSLFVASGNKSSKTRRWY